MRAAPLALALALAAAACQGPPGPLDQLPNGSCSMDTGVDVAVAYDRHVDAAVRAAVFNRGDVWEGALGLRATSLITGDVERLPLVSGLALSVTDVTATTFRPLPGHVMLLEGTPLDPHASVIVDLGVVTVPPGPDGPRGGGIVLDADGCPRLVLQPDASFPADGWATYGVFVEDDEITSVRVGAATTRSVFEPVDLYAPGKEHRLGEIGPLMDEFFLPGGLLRKK